MPQEPIKRRSDLARELRDTFLRNGPAGGGMGGLSGPLGQHTPREVAWPGARRKPLRAERSVRAWGEARLETSGASHSGPCGHVIPRGIQALFGDVGDLVGCFT